MGRPHNVFVCCSEEDRDSVDELVRTLEQLGMRARIDADQAGGLLWWDGILDAIRSSDVFLFALSPAALQSEACERQLQYAVSVDRPLLLVVVAETPLADVPPPLAQVQWVDQHATAALARAMMSVPDAPPLPNPLPTPPPVPVSETAAPPPVTAEALSFQEQHELAVELGARAGDDPDAIASLWELRRRPDLYAAVADQIDAILDAHADPPPSSFSGPTEHASPRVPSPFTIFVSYRREDSEDVTGRIRDRLKARFGPTGLFMDIDSIPPGIDFRRHIADAIESCEVVLVVIGREWLEVPKGSRRARLHDDRDIVRQEIRAALARDLVTIPILVQHATHPKEADLPDDIKDLAYRTSLPVRPGVDFDTDVARLIDALVDIADRHGHTVPAPS